MRYRQPSHMMFRCKLRVGDKLRDLGVGGFQRQRDAEGNWDGKTWQLKTLDYLVQNLPAEELPLVEEGKLIRLAIIQKRKNGGHRIACQIGVNHRLRELRGPTFS